MLKANVVLNFTTSEGQKAVCRASLAYHRLDEKILLKCYNAQNNLLFVFKTSDYHFKVFIPDREEVFSGNIFDLKNSANVHMHLQALDLYRALKTMAIPVARAESFRNEKGLLGIKVISTPGSNDWEREISISSQGDVLREVYYDKEGSPSVVIGRSGFQEIRENNVSTFFPAEIEIQSTPQNEERSGFDITLLKFFDVEFPSEVDESEFLYKIP